MDSTGFRDQGCSSRKGAPVGRQTHVAVGSRPNGGTHGRRSTPAACLQGRCICIRGITAIGLGSCTKELGWPRPRGGEDAPQAIGRTPRTLHGRGMGRRTSGHLRLGGCGGQRSRPVPFPGPSMMWIFVVPGYQRTHEWRSFLPDSGLRRFVLLFCIDTQRSWHTTAVPRGARRVGNANMAQMGQTSPNWAEARPSEQLLDTV